ncbi:MAG: CHASE domain-containing protein [Lentisphaerota bacterium]
MNHTDDKTGGLIMAASRRGGWLLLVLLLLTGLILTAIATRFTKSEEDAAAAMEFDFACKEIEGKILDRLNAHEQILRSGAAFFEQAGSVSRHKWRQFTARQKVEQQLPGIQGIGFALLIPHQKLAQHIKDIRAEGFPEYLVRPEGERDIYSSIIYLEPFTNRNLRAFGYDMLSEPVRRAAMERARDQDAATLSGKVFLVQETDKDVQAGTLMYVPVYHTDMPCETVAQRRAALIGWVYSPCRMNDLMLGILGRWDLANYQRIRLEIFDGRQVNADTLLYDSQPSGSRKTDAVSQLTLQRQILSSGHQWTLRFTKTGNHASYMEYSKVRLVLFGGTLTTLLLSGLFFNLYNTRFKARQLAGRLTADLQHVTTRLELAAGAGGVGIWDYEVPNNKLIWDDQMFRLYGITRAQFSGAYEAWTAGVHPEDRERGNEEIQMAIRGKKEFDTEFRVLWPDGSTHYIRAMACVQRNDAGRAERMIGTNWDITGLKQAEEALSRQTALLSNLLDSIPDIVFFKDLEGGYLGCNPLFAEFAGKTREEIIGHTDYDLFQKDVADAFREYDSMVMAENKARHNEEWIDYPDGRRVLIDTLKAPLTTQDGRVIGMLGISRDITDKKHAEAAFRESALQKSVSENLKSIIDNIPGTVYRISQDDTIKFLSLSGSSDMPSPPERISDNIFTSMPVIHPDDRQLAAASKKLLQSKKSSQVLVYRIIAEDNSVKWIEDRRTSIFNSDGRYMGIDGIMLDITARVKAEEERKALENSIRNKQRLETIGTLAGGIAHDFNNILVPILGYAELSVSTLPPEDPLYEYSTEIMKAAERAKNLVSQILTFSRPVESNLTPVPVQSLLKEALKLLRPSIPATINIKPLIDDSCRNVLADSSQIHQIIVNLCTNAFYAMKDTDGTLTIELHEVHDKSMYHVLCNSDAEYLMLSVSDTGTGMDESIMERIYEPFFTTKPVNEGTGLGLSVVHGIVKSCKGEITAESNKGKGSAFRVFLPVIEDAAEEIKISGNPVKGKGRVLFVDDEPAAVKFIFTMLSKLGYTTETTNSPTEALELFNRNPVHFDLIITDLTMPDMSGIELAKAIHEKNSGLPIILMTGHGKDLDYAIPPEDYGIRRILKKPVKINILASAIDEIIYLQEKEV